MNKLCSVKGHWIDEVVDIKSNLSYTLKHNNKEIISFYIYKRVRIVFI